MDTNTVNHIDGWSLIRDMSGSAFSTALRHAALYDMGGHLTLGFGYDVSGQLVDTEDENDPRIALRVDFSRS